MLSSYLSTVALLLLVEIIPNIVLNSVPVSVRHQWLAASCSWNSLTASTSRSPSPANSTSYSSSSSSSYSSNSSPSSTTWS